MRPLLQIGASFEPMLSNTDQFIAFEGARGTAKTRTILTWLVAQALKYPGSRILLGRNNRTDLSETVLATLEDQVFPAFGIKLRGGAHRKTREDYRLYNGSTFYPVGVDELNGKKLLSREVTRAYLAEATEIAEQSVRNVVGCMRWLYDPKERPTLPPTSQIILDFNPVSPAHWIYKACEPVPEQVRRVKTREDYARLQAYDRTAAVAPSQRWKLFVTKHQDNPGYWDHAGWDWTPLGRTYARETLETLRGFQRKRWLDGEPAAAEGSVFPEFSTATNTCPRFAWPGDWPMLVVYDPGYDHPCAVVFLGIAPNGQLYIVDRIYGSGITLPDLAGRIKAIASKYRCVDWLDDPRGANQATQAANGVTIRQYMATQGLNFRPWPAAQGAGKQAQVEGLRRKLIGEPVHSQLTLDGKSVPLTVKTHPLVVFSDCVEVIEEFQSWSFKRTADGSLPAGDDAYEDRNNHALDAIMGAIATNPVYEQKSGWSFK